MDNSQFPRMHVSLYVSNLEKTLDFYRNFFGQEAEKVKQGYAKFILEKPSLIISFLENSDRVNPGFGHLGFQVESPEILAEKMAVARSQGMVDLEEIGTACCYAVQDKFWALDPDGYRWEVYYFHEDSEWNDPQYQTESEACCAPSLVVAADNVQVKQTISLKNLNTSVPAGETCDPDSGCC